MKLYPKCISGQMPPFISAWGKLEPCCMFSVPKTNESIFDDPAFDLNHNKFSDVINSRHWANALQDLEFLQYDSCKFQCSTPSDSKPVINTLHMELTSRCSLACAYCPRTIEKIKNVDLCMDVVYDVLETPSIKRIITIGTYGDSIFYPHYPEFLDAVAESGLESYKATLAATGRQAAYWDDIVKRFAVIRNTGIIAEAEFSIDGLEDTCAIHKVGQRWGEIIYAMRAMVAAGIHTRWKFIPFKHNEHQIDEARSLAKQFGVQFRIHNSERFFKNDPNKPEKTYEY